jgi:hypothetical protein
MAEVTINKKLNLVLPVDIENGRIWVHSMPISIEVFDSNWLLLTKTLSNLYANGIGPAMAPRVAMRMLKETAKEIDDKIDISNPLIQEIYRLTNVLMPNPSGVGWRTVPYFEVKKQKFMDDQSQAEVDNAIAYFIVASAMHLKSELPMAYTGLKSIWNAQTTSLNITEYGNSLTTSTSEENTGETIPPPPPPLIPPKGNIGAPTPPRVVARLSSIPS